MIKILIVLTLCFELSWINNCKEQKNLEENPKCSHEKLLKKQNLKYEEYYSITATSLNFRSEPTINSKSLLLLNHNQIVKSLPSLVKSDCINNKDGFWFLVKTLNNKNGYVFSAYLEKVKLSTDDWKTMPQEHIEECYSNKENCLPDLSKNNTGLNILWLAFPRRQYCYGDLDKNINLKGLNISISHISGGTNCVAGDFDGNGYLDILLYGNYIFQESILPHPNKFMLLLYSKDGIIFRQIIEDGNLVEPVLYKKRKEAGEFGEPKSEIDGFWEPGEGGTTFIYLYNTKKKLFVKSEHASEYE